MAGKYFYSICLILAGLLFLPLLQAQNRVFTVVIDAGHGGTDPGTVRNGLREKNINLTVALRLGKLLSDNHPDVKVVYTRNTDKFITLDERANIANRNNADLFISIHTNAVDRNTTVRGTETFTLGLARSNENFEVAKRENSVILLEDDYRQRYEGFDPNSTESYIIFEFMQHTYMEQSIGLASEIQKAFTSVRRIDRGVRQAGFLVLRKTGMPSVLVELGFLSNPDEARYMNSQNGQKQLSEALYNAVLKYKRDYERKQGALAGQPDTGQSAAKPGSLVFKVQILASDKKLPDNSPSLKGYKAGYYVENGLYKYTYGETTDEKEIQKLRQTLAKEFKGAFVVSFRDGKKVTK